MAVADSIVRRSVESAQEVLVAVVDSAVASSVSGVSTGGTSNWCCHYSQ